MIDRKVVIVIEHDESRRSDSINGFLIMCVKVGWLNNACDVIDGHVSLLYEYQF